MGWLDYLLLVLIAGGAVWALVHALRHPGCGSDCSGCSGCSGCTRSGRQKKCPGQKDAAGQDAVSADADAETNDQAPR